LGKENFIHPIVSQPVEKREHGKMTPQTACESKSPTRKPIKKKKRNKTKIGVETGTNWGSRAGRPRPKPVAKGRLSPKEDKRQHGQKENRCRPKKPIKEKRGEVVRRKGSEED